MMESKKISLRKSRFHSELKRLLEKDQWIRGTINKRERTCGKPNCICNTGRKHSAVYLLFSKMGKTEQIYIPKEKEQEVIFYVKNYKKIKRLLERISSMNLQKMS